MAKEASLDNSLHYYGLSDFRIVKGGAIAEDRKLESRDNGILRASTVEQYEVLY